MTVYGFVFITASATSRLMRPTCSQAYLLELCVGTGMCMVAERATSRRTPRVAHSKFYTARSRSLAQPQLASAQLHTHIYVTMPHDSYVRVTSPTLCIRWLTCSPVAFRYLHLTFHTYILESEKMARDKRIQEAKAELMVKLDESMAVVREEVQKSLDALAHHQELLDQAYKHQVWFFKM